MPLVQFNNVVKRYGSKLSVDHLNLTIEEGEIFGLLGPNGAGKSTSIKMLSGILSVDQGEILVDGLSVKQEPLEIKRKIGVVPQELAIYETLTARENITFFGKLYGLKGNLLKERVNEALEFVGLLDRASEKPESFSGGMKRRLNIACAIMHHPKLIIMDEPTVGIDPQSRNHILESVKKLNQMGSTVIYTSHYMEEVESVGTRIGIMDHGRLIACGTKTELTKELGQEERLTLRVSEVSDEGVEELQRHPKIRRVLVEGKQLDIDMESTQSYLQDVLYVLSKHGMSVNALTRIEPNLESVFLAMTGRTLRD